jgi:hypothetical protein
MLSLSISKVDINSVLELPTRPTLRRVQTERIILTARLGLADRSECVNQLNLQAMDNGDTPIDFTATHHLATNYINPSIQKPYTDLELKKLLGARMGRSVEDIERYQRGEVHELWLFLHFPDEWMFPLNKGYPSLDHLVRCLWGVR